MLNNKGQIAETMTWVVATIIVVVTLIVFIFISTSLSKAKDFNPKGIVMNFAEKISDDVKGISRLEQKTEFAITRNSANEELIQEWIENE